MQLLKRERIRRQIYLKRDAAKTDVLNYIEMLYNPKRRHCTAVETSPAEFERRYSQRLKSLYGIRGDSILVKQMFHSSVCIKILRLSWKEYFD